MQDHILAEAVDSEERSPRDHIDELMLRSMSVSFRAGLEFSFNREDMADLLARMADRLRAQGTRH